jgi:RNA polymerase sigma-70 factor (ECF subfamily)
MDERPDEMLVAEAQKGGAEAFAELVRRHQAKIFRLCYGMTRNHSDADDLAQEVFLTAYKSLAGFSGKAGFYTWLYRIAVNRSLNFLKRRGREKGRTEFSENLAAVDGVRGGQDPPGLPSADAELEARLREAVETLPPRFKASFLLVVDQGLSHAEAARILGCSESTVSWRMHKARKALRARLEPYLRGAGS